ncbi:MAG: sigma-70 family RNA polymerase sigma factor [Planctomycetota bacterium]|nr:sigma-70 family RNA polymerase sigma factor [Planctomycetota bacterium]
MTQDRDNYEWINALQAEGPLRETAVFDLREMLLIGLKAALKSRSDFVASLLDDFVQDSLVRILRSLDQFQNRSRFATWATAVAIRVALTELRKRRWRDVSLERLVADTGFEPSAAVEATPDQERPPIITAMYRIIGSNLTDKQRTVLLAEIKGMAQEEIARQMGCSRNALYKLSHDARQRLKQGLENAGFTAQEYAITIH